MVVSKRKTLYVYMKIFLFKTSIGIDELKGSVFAMSAEYTARWLKHASSLVV